MTLSVTVAKDRKRANPTPAARTVSDRSKGEPSIAVTARSARSNVDHVTDPNEVPLNWIPIHGKARTVPFDWNTMADPARPSATRFPSTNNPIRGSNLTVVFGMIVRVTPGATVTWRGAPHLGSPTPPGGSPPLPPGRYRPAKGRGGHPTQPPH